MVVGVITTTAAMFPALVMKLLEFVALYGLILMPMGAIIIIDTYVLPRMNMKSCFSEYFNNKDNIPAILSWLLTLALCLFINLYFGLEVFFLGLPGWFIAAAIYLLASIHFQKKEKNA
jgi:cytosine/uracil/thiamine/allantoin permease